MGKSSQQDMEGLPEGMLKALQHSEGRFRNLVDATACAVMETDDAGRIALWNPAAASIFGFAPEETLGVCFWDILLSEETRSQVREAYAYFVATGESHPLGRVMEQGVLRKDGHLVLVEWTFLQAPSPEGWRAILLGRDRTVEVRNIHLQGLLRTVSRINKLLVRVTDAHQLLEEVCRALVETQAFRLAWIGLVEEGTSVVQPAAQAGFELGYLELVTITWDDSPTGRGPTGTAIRTGETSVCADIERDPRMALWRKQARRFGYRSSAAIPLRRDGRVVGALNVYAREPGAFDEETLSLLQELADNVAFGMEKIASDATVQAQLAELRARERLVDALLRTLDLDARLEIALREMTTLARAEMGAISLVEGDRLVVRRQSAVPKRLLAVIGDVPLEAMPWREKVTLSWGDEPLASTFVTDGLRREGGSGWVWLPLKAEGRLLGVFFLGSLRPQRLTDEQMQTLVALSDLVAVALQHARLYRQAQERLARLTVLREVDQAISASLSLDEIIDILLHKTLPHIPVDAVGVSLIDRERKRTVLARMHLPGGGRIEDDAFALADGLLEQLMVRREPVVIYDVRTDPRVQNYRQIIRRYDLCSYVGVPLVVQDEAIGVLHLLTTRPTVFGEETLEFFKILAGQAAISVQNARLYEEAVERYGGMRALADVALELQTHGFGEALASHVLDVARRVTSADLGGFFAYDEATRSLWLISEAGMPVGKAYSKEVPRFSLGEERGLVGLVAYTRKPLYLPDVRSDPRWSRPDLPVRSVYWVPLFHGEALFGVYALGSREMDGFSREQRALADTLGSYVSTALENARLFQETRRAYEELKSTQAQLLQAQKLEAIGRLAGGMAHDVNNHLAVIRLYADMIRRRLPEDSPLHSHLDEIRNAVERSSNLARQLLLFSRREPMEKSLLSLNVIVEDMEKMIGRLLGEDIHVDLVLQEDLWLVEADANNLEQVVMNLAVNARDAMPEGGTLTLETWNEVVTASHRHPDARPGRFVCLSVRDTGVGMADAVKAYLFEPFFTTKERGKGTGLGLSVVYGIVQAHEGWIEVESEVGRGSVFTIYLPALGMGDAGEGEATAAEPPAPRGRGERILLVEDEEPLRKAAAAALEEGGYRVYACRTVREAVEAFEQEESRFDLIIADVVLPNGKGPRLVERLLQRLPGLVALLISGYTDEWADWALIKERGVSFLQKPFSAESLLFAVRDLLQASAGSA